MVATAQGGEKGLLILPCRVRFPGYQPNCGLRDALTRFNVRAVDHPSGVEYRGVIMALIIRPLPILRYRLCRPTEER